MNYEGWTGGVRHWIFFSHGFQLTFTFKTVFKALDRDLHLVECCIWVTRPLFVRRYVIVFNRLWRPTLWAWGVAVVQR